MLSVRRSRPRPRERGLALLLSLFALATLVIGVAVSFLIGGADIRSTRSYRGASEVHFVAESGISQALQVANGPGVLNFQNDVYNQWSGIFGSGTRSFGAQSGYTYTVSPVVSATNPADDGRFLAIADGPEGAHNAVVASVTRSNVPTASPGAIYLSSNAPTNADFNGNAFQVDGNDHNYTGGMGSAPPVPGISTRNDTNTQEAINSLSSGQRDNVTGLGYQTGPPIIPSIMTSAYAPSVDQVNQIAADLLARAGVVVFSGGNVNGNATFGDADHPQITYFNNTSGTTIKGNGNASGAGILIVEGDLTIQGSIDFKGLIIVRGRTKVTGETDVTGNATVYGSLWTNDVNLQVGGSAIVNYSTQALALANMVSGGQALPAPLRVTLIADCAQVPAGSGGFPS